MFLSFILSVSSEIPITVERLPTTGTLGVVQVDFRTLREAQTFTHLPTAVSRASDDDFVPSNASVVFAPGETRREFNVTILDDATPEVDEALFVVLTGTTLLEPAQPRTGA